MAGAMDLTPGSFKGWTPIRISWRDGRPEVDWCHTEGIEFDDPFFEETVQRCFRHPYRLLFRRRTSLETLAAVAEDVPHPPGGFVFHQSRCGSTLVMQMLAAHGTVRVLSEPGPVESVLAAAVEGVCGFDRLVPLISVLGQGGCGKRAWAIKFDAWATVEIDRILQQFPGTPWVFLYRDPTEILVSQNAHRGFHMIPGALPPHRLGLEADRESLTSLSAPTYGAMVLARIAAAAHRALTAPGSRGLAVDYQQLPDAAFDIAAHFGICVDQQEQQAMAAAAGRDAKNPVLEFVPDTVRKQNAASAAVRNAVRAEAQPWYDRLRALRTPT